MVRAKAEKKKKKAIQFQIGWGGLTALVASVLCVLLWIFVLGFWVGQKIVGSGLKTSPEVTVLDQTVQPAAINPPPEPFSAKSKAALTILEDEEELPTEIIPEKKPLVETAKKTEKVPSKDMDFNKRSTETVKVEKRESVKPERASTSTKKVDSTQKKTSSSVAAPQKITKKVPAPTVKAMPDSSLSQGPYVVLQVASFKDRGKAMREADRWKRKGYESTYKRVNLGGKGIWFRVYLGRYPDFERARKAAREFAKKEKIQPYVVSVK